jgi:hypothetical protein
MPPAAALIPVAMGALGSLGTGAAALGSGALGALSSALPALGGAASAAAPALAGAGTGGSLLGGALSGLGGLAAPAAAPSLASSLGAGAMSLGGKMLPSLATSMANNAMSPAPPGAAPSYTTPDMTTQGQARTAPATDARLDSRTALSLLLGDMMDNQQRRTQGYGYGPRV